MKNAVLLNTLFAEYVEEVSEKTMHIDDIKAIERVQKLLTYELPYASNGKEVNESESFD